MAVLALVGFTGMFLRHRGRLGRLGRVGYALLTAGYLAHVRRRVHRRLRPPDGGALEPGYVQHVINAAMASRPERRHRPHARAVPRPCGIGYSLGGLLFGIALFRAGVLARWASLLLAYGTIVRARAVRCCRSRSSRPFACPPASR